MKYQDGSNRECRYSICTGCSSDLYKTIRYFQLYLVELQSQRRENMVTDTYQDISVEYDDQVATIQLNRPDKLNAIRLQTYGELISAFKAADISPECDLIVLSGKGEHFSAGNDLTDLVGDDHSQLMEYVQEIFTTVSSLQKVVIAAVDGVAVGIGTTILLHCDIVIASNRAKFRVPFANLGVGPEGGSSVLLPQFIGQRNAQEVLLTGRFFSAEEAHDWGLITRRVDPEDLPKVTRQYIDLLMKQPQASLVATKALMRASHPDVKNIVKRELEPFSLLLQTNATQDRIRSFIKT